MNLPGFSRDGPRALLTVERTLDWGALPAVSGVLALLEDDLSELTLDLSALNRLDNAGLGILLILQHKASEHGVAVTVRAPPDAAVAQTLATTRLDRLIVVKRGVDEPEELPI
jgi:anti-anti-sigma factor